MMFLIEYDRKLGKIVSFSSFSEVERSKAQDERLSKELDLNRRKVEHEVVLLEAASEHALRFTHRRYFEDAAGIGRSMRQE